MVPRGTFKKKGLSSIFWKLSESQAFSKYHADLEGSEFPFIRSFQASVFGLMAGVLSGGLNYQMGTLAGWLQGLFQLWDLFYDPWAGPMTLIKLLNHGSPAFLRPRHFMQSAQIIHKIGLCSWEWVNLRTRPAWVDLFFLMATWYIFNLGL